MNIAIFESSIESLESKVNRSHFVCALPEELLALPWWVTWRKIVRQINHGWFSLCVYYTYKWPLWQSLLRSRTNDRILAESVIVGALHKSISTAPSYQISKTWCSEGSDGIVMEFGPVQTRWNLALSLYFQRILPYNYLDWIGLATHWTTDYTTVL